MWTEIKLDDNCRITYGHREVLLKDYTLEYNKFNGITEKIDYDIYFNSYSEDGDRFIVRSFGKEDKPFETFDEAKKYALTEMCELYKRIMKEEHEIMDYVNTRNKRGRKKND